MSIFSFTGIRVINISIYVHLLGRFGIRSEGEHREVLKGAYKTGVVLYADRYSRILPDYEIKGLGVYLERRR